MSMNTFYGENSPASSPNWVKNSRPLGIQTKTHVMPTPQGFQRVHDYLLQDQSRILLPKERVSKCRRFRIDKTKPRTVMYNENR